MTASQGSLGKLILFHKAAHDFLDRQHTSVAVHAALCWLATTEPPYSGGPRPVRRLRMPHELGSAVASTTGAGSDGRTPAISVLSLTSEEIVWQASDRSIWQMMLPEGRARSRPLPERQGAVSARRLTRTAAFLAGRKHERLRDEWLSHLAGENGRGLLRKDQYRAACGFLMAAVCLRLHDAAELAWQPLDAILASRFLSGLLVWGPVIVMIIAIVHHDGRWGLVADIADPLALGTFLSVAIHRGRKRRGIKLRKPGPRRSGE